MPEYVIVYQISKESSNWLFAIPGLIVLIVGCVLFVGKVRFGWRRSGWYYPVAACIFGIMWFLEKIYNHKRLHSALGYVPPARFEKESATRQLSV